MNTQQPRRSKGLFKLVLVGTVALTATVLATLFLTQQPSSSITLFGAQMTEKEQAFLQFLARYGKTYASKGDVGKRFEVFSQNYEAV